MSASLKHLQNGTDIRGVTLEGIAGEDVNLTPEIAARIASAFIQWLARKSAKAPSALKIAVGMDSRLSGPALKAGLLKGLSSLGANVLDCGLASTPAMFMSTVLEEFACDGAVMITASHLPFNRNGFKFFTPAGGLDKADIAWILETALACGEDKLVPENVAKADLMRAYAEVLKGKIREGLTSPDAHPLQGLRILVDAGNGAGGFYVSQVLQPLGADTSGSLFLEPDGKFPNHAPNPEDNAAIEPLRKAVVQHAAALGIIFDTDVDRAAVVDASGEVLNRNRLVALAAMVVLEEHPNTTIVTDSITSDGLTAFIQDTLGGKHHRFKRGYKNVINEAIRLNKEGQETHLAIETSGHAALKENYFLDDGAYLATKLLIRLAQLRTKSRQSLISLISQLIEPKEDREFRIRILAREFAQYGELVMNDLKSFVASCPGWALAKNNFEGIRVACDARHGDGWFLLRLSLHDPVLPLNIESNQSGGVKLIADQLRTFLSAYPELDSTTLAS